MNTPKISIIMPVYNAEKSVARMIDSILNQTFSDWELLIVNDGSTDGSGVILDDYSYKDKRIRVIHKKNEGVAVARQIGINEIRGEYSIHADSDDWVEPLMLERMYKVATERQLDMVITDYYIHSSNGKLTRREQKPISYDSLDVLYQILTGKLFGALWNKLIRSSLYKTYNVSFFKGIDYSEDVLVLAQMLCRSNLKIGYESEAYYHYILNETSITNQMSRKTFKSLEVYYAKLSALLPEEPRFVKIKESLPLGLFTTGFLNRFFLDKDVKSEFEKVRRIAYQTTSKRWTLGYWCLELGLYSIARKLLK